MKKIVGTILAIALVASSAFAEVNVGMGFNVGLFVPAAKTSDGELMMATVCPFGQAPRVGVSFSASNDECGVVADIKFDGGKVAVNDNAYIWVKPLSWLKLQVGQSFDDTLRGSYGIGSNDWLRPGNILNDDITFMRPCEPTKPWETVKGAIISLDPIEGLHIVASFNTWYGENIGTDADPDWYFPEASEVFKNAQFQAGYTVADIVQVKAQWIGWAKQVNAAVALKAVENMTLEAGVYIPTESNKAIKIGAFWGMPVGPVVLKANGQFETKVNDANPASFKAGFAVDYDFGNGVAATADVVLGKKLADGQDMGIAFGAFVTKSIANGCFGIGFQGASKDTIRDFKSSDFTFAVPVKVQVGF